MIKRALLVVGSAVLLSACTLLGGPKSTTTSTSEPTTQTEMSPAASPAKSSITVDENGITTIEVVGNEFSYDLKEIKVKKGDKVQVKFVNSEGFHDFVIDELNVKTKQIAADVSETVTIPTDKVGTYEYYCSVGKHREMGMVGKLIIE